MTANKQHHAVIVGGGFGGMYAAKALKNAPLNITLIDKRNFHLFQPLLYQVATGGLSPGDIAYPLRSALSRQQNSAIIQAEVIDIDPVQQKVFFRDGDIGYDSLIVATGMQTHYFGHPEWGEAAPGLKSIEDALEMRRRILTAFEAAEREPDPDKRRAWLNFVVVGGGPTGVELAGALAELAHKTLQNEFSNIDPAEAKILLLEGVDRILPPYPPSLSAKAADTLARLGVTVKPNTMVTDLEDDRLTVRENDHEYDIEAKTVLWAAGMKASPLGRILAERTGCELDRSGRVVVEPDLSMAGYPNIFVIGDLAHFAYQNDQPLPGVAPVAMQQGQYVADLLKAQLKGDTLPSFHYVDKGSLAVIGRNAAVAQIGLLKISGSLAWLAWIFIHIWYLIGFDNKLLVIFQWAWNYITWKRGARLITERAQE